MIKDEFHGVVTGILQYEYKNESMVKISYRPNKETNVTQRMGGAEGLVDLNIDRDIDKMSLTRILNATGKNVHIINQGIERNKHHSLPMQSVAIEDIPVYERVNLRVNNQNPKPEKKKSFWSKFGL